MLALIRDVAPIAIPTDAFGVAGGVIVTILLAGLSVLWRDQQKRGDERRKRDDEIWAEMLRSGAEDRQQRDDGLAREAKLQSALDSVAQVLKDDVADRKGRRRSDDP